MGRDASVYFREPPSAHGLYHMIGMFETSAVVKKASQAVKKEKQKREKEAEVAVVEPEDLKELRMGESENAKRPMKIREELSLIVKDFNALEASASSASSASSLSFSSDRTEKAKLVRKVKLTTKKADGSMHSSIIPMIEITHAAYDPWSYTQTVENLFYLSFTVKMGYIGVCMGEEMAKQGVTPMTKMDDKSGVTWVIPRDQGELQEVLNDGGKKGAGGALQFTFSLDMDSWKSAMDKMGVKKPMLTHFKRSDCTCPPGTKHPDPLVMQALPEAERSGKKQNRASAVAAREKFSHHVGQDDDTEEETGQIAVQIESTQDSPEDEDEDEEDLKKTKRRKLRKS